MASEPKYNLKQVCTKIDLEDFAKILQLVDGEHRFKDVSACARHYIHSGICGVEIDNERREWIELERDKNIKRRARKRGKRSWLYRKIFGED